MLINNQCRTARGPFVLNKQLSILTQVGTQKEFLENLTCA